MKPLYRLALITLPLLGCLSRSAAQLTVTTGQTATALAQNLAGSGVTVLNATLTCAAQGNGSFTAVSSSLGISDGIVLTTGNAAAVAGPEPGLTSFNNNTGGDPDLTALSGASTTRDACILQFDLVPKGDTVKFDYVFGSEEYINSICGPYNDAFAFFISGPGITGIQNIARVPGTNIPVAVNSINTGIPGPYGSLPNCTAMGPGAPFTTWYNNNQGSTTVAYRGLTTVLTAAQTVIPCDTYHLKLTVADAVNGLYDSGVFIKAGSLQSTTYDVALTAPLTVGGLPTIYKGCSPATLTFSRSVAKPTPQVLTFVAGGDAIGGTDYAALPASVTIPANATQTTLTVTGLTTPPAGAKLLKLYLNAPVSCAGTPEFLDSVILQLLDTPSAVILTPDTVMCQGGQVRIRVAGSNDLQYSWTPASGLNNPAIKEPVASPGTTTTYALSATLPGSGCAPISGSLTITLLPIPGTVEAGEDMTLCEHTPVLINPDIQPDDPEFTYSWTGPHGFTATTRELSIADPLSSQSGYYYVSVSGGVCGSATDSVKVDIVTFPSTPVVNGPFKYCLNEEVSNFPLNDKDLVWYKTATGNDRYDGRPAIITSAEGVFDFYVSRSLGSCESERVKLSVIVERCCDDYIFIPSAFTPNNDGRNDLFEIAVRNGSKVTRTIIYNRWGQLLYDRSSDQPWNGTHQGKSVDQGNYYYLIEVTCKDGTLIRRKGEVLVVK
ncbi:choice-of-anchor L domain-containing protein [Taibaiella koreensis]|uniref:choice-of-anchor L domain-containing protein n=1 Tax=Taibaiella koreensis TaxID=1268548 RepID=UPI000E599941|nr:choice-of-anchor L domain-containing protein [Taibaiella koreensis]